MRIRIKIEEKKRCKIRYLNFFIYFFPLYSHQNVYGKFLWRNLGPVWLEISQVLLFKCCRNTCRLKNVVEIRVQCLNTENCSLKSSTKQPLIFLKHGWKKFIVLIMGSDRK